MAKTPKKHLVIPRILAVTFAAVGVGAAVAACEHGNGTCEVDYYDGVLDAGADPDCSAPPDDNGNCAPGCIGIPA